ncbi:hypothetical protein QFZ74_003267 [Streptomyces sp. V3I7]|nr:hypothetical protein [Streptomyces sp. V3I7]
MSGISGLELTGRGERVLDVTARCPGERVLP